MKTQKPLKAPDDLYTVMVAGGVGTRLWPLSVKSNPKQFLQIFSENGDKDISLVQITYNRFKGFLDSNHLFTVASSSYSSFIKDQLPDIPTENIIEEPKKGGTTVAIIFAALWVMAASGDKEAVVHFLVSDDHLEDPKRFRDMVLESHTQAKKGKIVVFGVKPRFPAPGYGHIKVNSLLTENTDGIRVYDVNKFVEKPDIETAEKYVESGDYYWHGSGFMSRVDVILEALKDQSEEIYKLTQQLQKAIELPTIQGAKEIGSVYSKFPDTPIEYTLLEKANNVVMTEMENTWSDLGDWSEVFEVFRKRGRTNVVLGRPQNVIQIDSKDSMIYSSDRMVALVGIDNMVVIDTPQAVLVCPKEKSQEVKELVNKLKELDRKDLL